MTSFAQLVASELGVEPSQVQVIHGDTSLYPTGVGTSASSGLIVGGSALYSVLQEARSVLSNAAAQLLGCSPTEIRFEAGKVFGCDNPGQGISIAELLATAQDREMLPGVRERRLEFNGSYTLPDSPYSFAAHVVVVEVSRDTGQVSILRYGGVHDSGRIINPMLSRGPSSWWHSARHRPSIDRGDGLYTGWTAHHSQPTGLCLASCLHNSRSVYGKYRNSFPHKPVGSQRGWIGFYSTRSGGSSECRAGRTV